MQLDSQMYLFGVLILLVSFLLNLIVVLIVRKSIRNDKMSKMIVMQQSAFRTESASTLEARAEVINTFNDLAAFYDLHFLKRIIRCNECIHHIAAGWFHDFTHA